MIYLNIPLSLVLTALFFVALFGAMVTVPRQAVDHFSYKMLVRVTRPLRVGGIQAFFYWAAPILIILVFSLWAGMAILATHVVGAIVRPRLLATPVAGPGADA